MKSVLLFGFEPFDQEPINPSGEAALALDGWTVDGMSVRGIRLPVEYQGAFAVLSKCLIQLNPVAVLGLGQGAGEFRWERLARNVAGTRRDNAGMPGRLRVAPGGPDTLCSALPTTRMEQALKQNVLQLEQRVPCVFSDDAGDYVCNHTLYLLLAWAGGRVPCGFLHLPKLNVLAQESTTRAVRAAVAALLEDLRGSHSAARTAERTVSGDV